MIFTSFTYLYFVVAVFVAYWRCPGGAPGPFDLSILSALRGQAGPEPTISAPRPPAGHSWLSNLRFHSPKSSRKVRIT